MVTPPLYTTHHLFTQPQHITPPLQVHPTPLPLTILLLHHTQPPDTTLLVHTRHLLFTKLRLRIPPRLAVVVKLVMLLIAPIPPQLATQHLNTTRLHLIPPPITIPLIQHPNTTHLVTRIILHRHTLHLTQHLTTQHLLIIRQTITHRVVHTHLLTIPPGQVTPRLRIPILRQGFITALT